VHKTFQSETETEAFSLEIETETLAKLSEARPRRDLEYVSRPSRDRDVETETTSLVFTFSKMTLYDYLFILRYAIFAIIIILQFVGNPESQQQ
jgi:hypothetical protein